MDEDGAELITPSAEISSVNASIESDADSAASSYKEKTSEVRTVIPSETGEMSNATQAEFNKADAVAEAAAIKAKVPSDPQTAKVKDAVSTNKTLPPKEPVIKPTKLTPQVNTSCKYISKGSAVSFSPILKAGLEVVGPSKRST